jgi:hypothetical protein
VITSGCKSGAIGLSCLGTCLRRNRSLQILKCDGQANDHDPSGSELFRLADGWMALRGCFYGNKKIIDLSYPWSDVTDYFNAVAGRVDVGWRQTASLKQQVGQAHRAFQMARKAQLIQQMVALKRGFLGLERTRCKVVQTLHDMYEAVQANADMHRAMQESKQEQVWASEKVDVILADIATAQDGILTKLWAQLMKFAKTQPQPGAPGGPPASPPPALPPPPVSAAAPSQAPSSTPAPTSRPAQGAPPVAPPAATFTATVAVPPGPQPAPVGPLNAPTDPVSRAWQDIAASIASGPELFTPAKYQRFVALVHSVGGHKDPKLSSVLKAGDKVTAKAAVKAAKYNRSPMTFALAVRKTNPQVYQRYSFLSDPYTPYDWYDYDNYRYRESSLFSADRSDKHQGSGQHHHHGDDGNHHDTSHNPVDVDEGQNHDDNNDNGYAGNDDAGNTGGDGYQDGGGDGPAGDDGTGDGEGEGGGEDGGDNDADGTGDGGDADAGDAGNGGEGGGDGDVDDAVGMYAGAGPRDLPDGEPDNRHDAGAIRVTETTAEEWTAQHTELSSRPPPRAPATYVPVGMQRIKNFAVALHRRWQAVLGKVLDAHSSGLLCPLEFKTQLRYAATRARAVHGNTCTLVTQCSVDRLDRLAQQAIAWNSSLSAAVYISTGSVQDTAEGLAHVRALVARLDADSTYTGELVISVLYGHEDSPWLWDSSVPGGADGPLYPINALRNAAASVATTVLMFLVDVDFVPSPGLQEWVESRGDDNTSLIDRCCQGDLIVVPAFERTTSSVASRCASALTFEDVCTGIDDASITAFHVQHFPAGHSPTDYVTWRTRSTARDTATYPVRYGEYYEPYVIMARSCFVPYDERFRGYGMNKCIHLRALAERGHTFHVLPGHFLVAECHERSVAHQRTYGSESGYRKHVVAAAYRAALGDIRMGKLPTVSATTARLLRLSSPPAACAEHSNVQTDRTGTEELKTVLQHMLLRSQGLLSAPPSVSTPLQQVA